MKPGILGEHTVSSQYWILRFSTKRRSMFWLSEDGVVLSTHHAAHACLTAWFIYRLVSKHTIHFRIHFHPVTTFQREYWNTFRDTIYTWALCSVCVCAREVTCAFVHRGVCECRFSVLLRCLYKPLKEF